MLTPAISLITGRLVECGNVLFLPVQIQRTAHSARMLVKTGKAFVDTSAMTTQMRADSDFWLSLIHI